MSWRSTRILSVGVFYAVVLTLVGTAEAHGVDPEFARMADRLERATRSAYASSELAHYAEFETLYAKLCDLYRRTGRLQELAWTHFEFDFDADGEAVEREILYKMAGDEPLGPPVRLVDHSARVQSLTYADGFRAVLVGTDYRVASRPQAAAADQRRFAVEVYHVSRALGFNLVPVTTFVARDGLQYLVRAYVADVRPSALDHRTTAYASEQLHVLDYLTEQLDRNPTGMGERPGGYPVAFDSKHAFLMGDLEFGPKVVAGPAGRPPAHISVDTRARVERLKRKLAEPHAKRFAFLKAAEVRRLEQKIEILLRLPVTLPAPMKPTVTPAPTAPSPSKHCEPFLA